MADDGAITVLIRPDMNEQDLRDLVDRMNKILRDGLKVGISPQPAPTGGGGGGGGGSAGGDPSDDGNASKKGSVTLKEALKDYLKDEDNQRKLAVKAIGSAETAISSGLKKGFGIVEDIYARLKSASPLLQAIESLFQIAMTLFFMPLGNKLAEILIPATVELLDNVVKMWDAFEGMSLNEMFNYAISTGVKLFADYFNNIGSLLSEQGGMVGNIGKLLQTLGSFIQGPGVNLLNLILNAATLLLGNLKHFISLWVAMKAAEIAMKATGFLGDLGLNIGIGAAAAAVLGSATLGFVGTEVGTTVMGLADGGYVPATPGGQLRVLGEGGRGEYVIPEDKTDSFGSKSVTLNFYGYNEDQMIQKVNDTVNQQISQSRLRSGF